MSKDKKREEIQSAYKRIFKTDDGKIVLKDLEQFCNFKRPVVCEHAPNALQTMFADGKRRVFLRILGLIEKDK